jgi:hypothetical protein
MIPSFQVIVGGWPTEAREPSSAGRAGPSAVTTFTANVTSNLIRNVWTHSVIMCGHFPAGVETFEKASIEGETRGE